MKIRLAVFIIILTGFFGSAFSQIKLMDESDREVKKLIEEYIIKDIVSATLYRYDVDSGSVSTESEKISKTVLDANRRIMTMTSFYPNYSRTVVSFDESNDITDVTIFYEDNTVMSRIKTNYDSDKKVTDKIYYFGSSYTFKVRNKFTSGNVTGQEYVDSLGKKMSYSKVFYDNANRLIEEDKYNSFDSLEIIYSYQYDGNGNCTEEMIMYPSSKIISKTMFSYDKDNRVTEKVYYGNGNKVSSRNEMKYGKDGKLAGDYTYALDDKMIIKVEYKYNEKGNKTEWKYSDLQEDLEYLYKVVYNE